jgi:hypothetical protein
MASDNILSINPSTCPQLVAIDLPILTNSKEKAIELLGGQERIDTSLKISASTIQAHFNTHLFDKPLTAERIPCSGILLKLKRKRRNVEEMNSHTLDQSSSSSASSSSSSSAAAASVISSRDVAMEYTNSAEVLGFVSHYYSFNAPIDYQVSESVSSCPSILQHTLTRGPFTQTVVLIACSG